MHIKLTCLSQVFKVKDKREVKTTEYNTFVEKCKTSGCGERENTSSKYYEIYIPYLPMYRYYYIILSDLEIVEKNYIY